LKTSDAARHRGFESLSLRQSLTKIEGFEPCEGIIRQWRVVARAGFPKGMHHR
jgi:hypothetical protein